MPAAQDITEKLEEQESRQAELNHYVKMVLPDFFAYHSATKNSLSLSFHPDPTLPKIWWKRTRSKQLVRAFRGFAPSKNDHMSVPDIPNSKKFTFQMLVMIANHRRNLGCVLKIETLRIPPICPWPSQTVSNIDYFDFSLVGKIWDGQDTLKSLIV